MSVIKSISLKALKDAIARIRADTASQIIELTTVLAETVNEVETLQTQVEELRAQVSEMRDASDTTTQIAG